MTFDIETRDDTVILQIGADRINAAYVIKIKEIMYSAATKQLNGLFLIKKKLYLPAQAALLSSLAR